ncbi:MAG TPA: ABC transporter permease [Gemmatimonadales bacterium]|nr:ABC transporter permease [Gemmatimonadales bacterium]
MNADLMHDLRYVLRSLSKAPGFTFIVLLTLALGIGANTAIFTVLNAVLLRPLPFADANRLVAIRETFGQGMTGSVAGPNVNDWRSRSHSFSGMLALRASSRALVGDGPPEQVFTAMVSADFFRTLGVPPALGRGFADGEDRGMGTVAVLSDGLWRSRYAADPGVIGRTITLSGQPYTVIGIAPPGFTYPGNAVAWLPMEYGLARSAQRSSHSYDVVGRLAPGVSLEAARADLAAVARELERENPVDNGGRGVEIQPLTADTVRAARPVLLLLGGAALFVLLIACANVANLFLARAAVRQRELAVRSALGAGRWRLARQVLVEGVLLSLAGGLIGLLLASWGVDLLLALRPRGIPRLDEIGIDHATLAFAIVVSVVVGIGFALFPALTLSHSDPADAFRGEGRGVSGGRSGGRFRAGLVVAQVSLALVLLAGAALLVVTVRRLALIDPGFDPRNAYTFELTIPPGKYPDRSRHDQYLTRVVEAVSRVRGTRAAGATFYLPLGNGQVNGDFTVAGAGPAAPGRERYANFRMVTGDYFAALSIPARRGRLLSPEDRAGAPHVAVVNEALARMAWPDQDPIGRRLTFGDGQDDPDWMEVVGVVANVKTSGLTADIGPEIYVPFSQITADLWTVFTPLPVSVVVRSDSDLETVGAAIKAAIRSVDPEQPVTGPSPASELIAGAVARQRFGMLLLLAFGGLALLLAAVGVYGVMAYAVSQRTRELGIRLALGARPATVRALVLGQGMVLAGLGIGCGLVGALVLGRLLVGLLYGVQPTDPRVLVAVAALLAAASVLACLVPAVRATRVNPVDALRSE